MAEVEDRYNGWKIFNYDSSKWICYMFGSTTNGGISWRPMNGEEPNWFWRLMQYLVFGNRWIKDKEK